MALVVISGTGSTTGSTTSDSRTLSWTIPSLAVGDVVVVAAMTWDQPNTLNPPTGTGLTFTQRSTNNNPNFDRMYIWTAVAASSGTNVVVTCSILAGGANVHNGVLYQCPTADGYSLAGTPNTLSSAPHKTGSLSGTSGNLAIVCVGDWDGNAGAITWAPTGMTLDQTCQSAGINSQYFGHITLAASTTTVGVSSPAVDATSAVLAIEVLKSGGGTPGTFTTTAGNADAAGGSSSFAGAGTFSSTVGNAPAAGGSTSFTATATFSTTAGNAPADGGSSSFTGAATFSTSAGDAPADGGTGSFTTGGAGNFITAAGDAPAAGGSSTFTGGAVFTSLEGTAAADGGSSTFTGAATFTTTAADATAGGGVSSFLAAIPATFSTLAGSAAAAGGSSSFTGDALFESLAGDVTADGGSSSFTGGAVFVTLAGDAAAAGGSSTFFSAATREPLPAAGNRVPVDDSDLRVPLPIEGTRV